MQPCIPRCSGLDPGAPGRYSQRNKFTDFSVNMFHMAPNIQRRWVQLDLWGHYRGPRRQPKRPAERDDASSVFYFPGEVARILKLPAWDYHQLRRLFRALVAVPPPSPTPRTWTWSRYTFRDLVSLRTALRLAEARGGKRDFRSVLQACRLLRDVFGLVTPLSDVQLDRFGEEIVARIHGRLIGARTGQLVMAEVANVVSEFVRDHCNRDGEQHACIAQLTTQSREVRMDRRGVRETIIAVSRRAL